MSDSLRPHGLQPTRLLCLWDFPGKSTAVGCHCLLRAVFPSFFNLSLYLAIRYCGWPEVIILPGTGSFVATKEFKDYLYLYPYLYLYTCLPIRWLQNIQGSLPLGSIGSIPLLAKGLSKVFFNITGKKHQLLGAHPSLWSNSHIHTWLLKKVWIWL